MSDKPLLIGLTVATGLLVYKLYKDGVRHELSLPPSPQSYPLIGHLLSFPSEYEHLEFMRLEEQLGSKILSLHVFGTTLVVMNDKDDAANLFDKRSAIYSDRTCPTMVQEPSLQAVTAHHGSQEHATRKLLQRLVECPKDIRSSHELEVELYLSISATLFRSLYGYEVHSSSDPLLVRSQKLIAYLTHSSLASNCLVNTIPILRYVPEWFPGAKWKRDVLKWKQEKEALIDELYKIGLQNTEKGETTHAIAGSLRNQALDLGLTQEEADDYAKHISITMLAVDTKFQEEQTQQTVGQVLMFLLAMVLYPEVQKKAQEELDSVIGNARLPAVEDRDQLGYTERVVQETLRWGPASPLAVPHTCSQDDTYKGYHIPKGAIVFGNVWAMTRDKVVYKDPETFNPDRFLDPSIPPSPVFGWGRRRCPGVHFAHASLFITIASILMTFDIGVAKDENGNDIIPSGKMNNSTLLSPQNFVFTLTPRSAAHEKLIRQSL